MAGGGCWGATSNVYYFRRWHIFVAFLMRAKVRPQFGWMCLLCRLSVCFE